MDGLRRRTTAATAAVLLAISGVGLAGCSGDGDTTIVTDDGTVTLNQDDEKIDITTSEGSMTINGESDGELPAGWPAEVPVPSGGSVETGMVMSGTEEQGWSATLSYPDSSTDDVSAELDSLFTGQGFESTTKIETSDGTLNAYTGDGFAITAMVSDEGGTTMLVMSVAVTD